MEQVTYSLVVVVGDLVNDVTSESFTSHPLP